MRKLLEVIVTSVEDAIEAEAGGADRLELVRDLANGGLTPPFEIATRVLETIKIPVRIMLRERPDMLSGDTAQLQNLQRTAARLMQLPVDGLVVGFVDGGILEKTAISAIADVAPGCRFTFHRAFDELADPLTGLEALKAIPQIDRVLTIGGKGAWAERKARLVAWQRAAGKSITLLVGAGLSPDVLADLAVTPELREVHFGRAARRDHSADAPVQRDAVRTLRNKLK